MNIFDEIKQLYKNGGTLIQLIIINVAIFVAVSMVYLFLYLFNIQPAFSFLPILGVPAGINNLLAHFWTPVTYMFFHEDFFHILFNMLWLFWFGKIFIEYLPTKKLLSVYVLGGICGAFLYIIAYNFLPVFADSLPNAHALGASAAVLAVVTAIAFYMPNYSINLLFIGSVKLKYIAIFSIVLDLISIPHGNAGGHIAHLGGALYGYLFITQFKKGRDISKGYDTIFYSIVNLFKPKKRMKVSYKRPGDDYAFNKMKVDNQKEIDRILEKISKGGYESLSKQEKEVLFKAGK